MPPELRGRTLPRHLAVIMDGNARWAQKRGLTSFFGHRAGLESLRNLVRCCEAWHIPALTVFAFSFDNWKRPEEETAFLMSLFARALTEEGDGIAGRGTRLRVIGERTRVPKRVREEIQRVEALTSGNDTGLQLTVALSYSGQRDLAAAARAIARLAALGLIDPEDVDESMLQGQLALAPVLEAVGPPDLLVRTSGEARLSNFLLWELAYTELVFREEAWPDFREGELREVLVEYGGRARRFGGRPPP